MRTCRMRPRHEIPILRLKTTRAGKSEAEPLLLKINDAAVFHVDAFLFQERGFLLHAESKATQRAVRTHHAMARHRAIPRHEVMRVAIECLANSAVSIGMQGLGDLAVGGDAAFRHASAQGQDAGRKRNHKQKYIPLE